jgi:hypothetical protein
MTVAEFLDDPEPAGDFCFSQQHLGSGRVAAPKKWQQLARGFDGDRPG